MANNSNMSKRAALHRQQEMDERNKKARRITIGSIVVLAIVAVVVIAVVAVQALTNPKGVTADQQTPAAGTDGYGVLIQGKQPSDDLPHLVIWEDYLCPYCGLAEQTYGQTVKQLVADGKMTAEIRTTFFLDGQRTNGPSRKAAMAAAAAAGVGKFDEYHAALYADQAAEAVGFPESELRDRFARAAGIEGDDLKEFQELYDTGAFTDWIEAANDRFFADQISGTPTYLVGDEKLPITSGTIPTDADGFLAAVEELAAQQ